MAHGNLCPCPNCGGGTSKALIGLGLIILVAVLAGARAVAPALGRLVHDVLLWASVTVTVLGAAAIGGYVAVSHVQDRRRRAASAAPISQPPRRPEPVSERLRVPPPRDGGR